MATQTTRPEPPALAYSADNCSIGRSLAIIGEQSTFLVIREVFNGIRRFEDMRVRTAIPKQVLTDRLSRLVEHGILRKEPYQIPGARARHEYRLTEKGLALYPILVAMADWGDRHLADPEGPPAEFRHRGCGEQVHVSLVCDAGHAVGVHRDVEPQPGPGAHRRDVS